MKRFPNIELTDKELDLIIEDGVFDYGGEAIVCRNNNPHSLYKIFTEPGSLTPDVMSDNKYKKILHIYQNPLQDTIYPLATISNRGSIIGYEVTFDEDDEALFNAILQESEKEYYLHKTAIILRYYATQNITYGDVKSDNILINKKTKKAKFCDIDNMKIGDYPIDVMGHGLTEYFEKRKIIDENADAFMHNLLFLEQLKYNEMAYNRILANIAKNPVMPEFCANIMRVIESLNNPKEFTGEYAIEYIKRR